MFSEISHRKEIQQCFDANEVDSFFLENRKSIKKEWEIERIGKVRSILRVRAEGHPLMRELLSKIPGNEIRYFPVFAEVENEIWGIGDDIVSRVIRELVDATQRHG